LNKPAIQVEGVSKYFGSAVGVKDIDLSIAAGEFFSLLGPSGCGKTTLLRMIAGFEQPSCGRILVNGQDMTGVPPYRRPVNMVFQSYALFPHLTVADNVAFGLRSGQTINREEIRRRVEEALDLVRLGSYGQRFPAQLSGGQQQRVALARAVVNRPAVLLLDEPLSALDLKIREEMQEELARLQSQLGITFVMVTHDQGEALALSNRLAVFYQGRLEQLGTPEEIFERPRTTFVADFIGHNNLLEAVVVEAGAHWLQVKFAEDLMLWVKNNEELTLAPGDPVVVWIASSAITLSLQAGHVNSASAEPVNVLPATVVSRSYQGTVTDYRLQISPNLSWRATLANSQNDFIAGQAVSVSLPASLACVLPVERAGKSLAAVGG